MSSWFTSIAGKAEALLNQLDEAAATSFQEVGMTTPPKPTPPSGDHVITQLTKSSGLSYEPVAQPITTPTSTHQSKSFRTSTPPTTWESSAWSSPSATRISSSDGRGQDSTKAWSSAGGHGQITDESLMEFLNSPVTKKEKAGKSAGKRKVGGHQQAKGITVAKDNVTPSNQDESNKNQNNDELLLTKADIVRPQLTTPSTPPLSDTPLTHTEEATPISPVKSQPAILQDTDLLPPVSIDTVSIATIPIATVPIATDTVSSAIVKDNNDYSLLENENHRLRQELIAIGDELNEVRKRNKETNQVESQLKGEIQTLRQQCSQLDQLVRRMRSQEDDLTSALEARDSQIHVLRNQLHESDIVIKKLKEEVEGADKEKDRFLQDISKSSEAQNQALLTLKTQLEQTKLLLSQSEDSKTKLQIELVEREREWNKERDELTDTVYSQGKELKQQQMRYTESHTSLQSALQTSNQDYQQLKKEYSEYKQKAAKDKLIQSLNSSETGQGNLNDHLFNELKTENYQLQSQIVNNEQVILSLRTELQELEETHSIEIDHLRQQIELAQETLDREKDSHYLTQEELANLQKEIDQLKDNFVKERAEMAGQLHERDETIRNLTAKVTSAINQSNPSRIDLEQRLKELTEKLIDKQTNLEQANVERHSLQLQLEKSQANLTELQRNRHKIPNQYQTALQIDTTMDEDNTQLRPTASILPSTTTSRQRHMQRVKSTLDSFDKIGLRFAWVLRRYPYIRLIALIYILSLHIWVMIVLFTYKPEIHDH